jgi:hypothetical protein
LYCVIRSTADRSDAGEHPGQLGVPVHVRLHDNGRDAGIDSGGQKKRGDLGDLMAELTGILKGRDGVEVDDAEDALVVVLDADPAFQSAQVVADVEISRRLNA